MIENINVETDFMDNDYIYESLLSAIESSQGMLSLLIVSCEPGEFQNGLIDRYETELAPTIPNYRITLDPSEPSLRAALEHLVNDRPELQQLPASAVITVTSAADLRSIKLQETETNSPLDRFFGYLQWTREGLREFPYPIVLWVTPKILTQLSSKAPDFWSWRAGIFRFTAPVVVTTHSTLDFGDFSIFESPQQTTDLPLDELLEQIAKISEQNSISPALATLFDRVGQIYSSRSEGDYLDNWQKATDYFNRAISIQKKLSLKADLANTFIRLGGVYYKQRNWEKAIACDEQSLETYHQLGDRRGEAQSLGNLGNVYLNQGKWEEAIAFYEQSLKIFRQLGDRHSVGQILTNLGLVHERSNQIEQARTLWREALTHLHPSSPEIQTMQQWIETST